MIWSLAREQLRSQRRYALTTGVLIAITVALAVYGVLMAASLFKTAAAVEHFIGSDRESQTQVEVPSFFSHAELTTGIDDGNAEGRAVVAEAELAAILPDAPRVPEWVPVHTMYGDVAWHTVLVDGSAPRPGEIAVPAEWAANHSYAIGDSLALQAGLWHNEFERYPLDVTLTVSGLTRSPVYGPGVRVDVPSAFVSWADAERIQAEATTVTNQHLEPLDGDPRPSDFVPLVSGNGAWMWSDRMSPQAQTPFGVAPNAAKDIITIAAVGVSALVIGTFAMAFALGRAQAQVRSRWVATARALGATRAQIVWATALESLAIGAAAGVVGYAIGAATVALHLRAAAAGVVAPMLLTPAWLTPLLIVGAMMFALVLALIVGAVPAFWSARVQPATALRPVSDLSEADVSRRVAVGPLAIAWTLSLAFAVYAATVGVTGAGMFIVIVAVIILFVGGIMLAHELLRWSIPRHAKMLSLSPRRYLIVAGDAIQARPRQSTVPAFIASLATFALVASLLPQVAYDAWEVGTWYSADPAEVSAMRFASLSPGIIVGTFAIVTLLCVAVSVATATLTAREAAARETLGMTRRDTRAAGAAQYLVAQGHGLVLGLVAGLVPAAFLIANANPEAYGAPTTWAGAVAISLVVILAAGAACALIGATIVGAFAPKTAPLAKMEAAA